VDGTLFFEVETGKLVRSSKGEKAVGTARKLPGAYSLVETLFEAVKKFSTVRIARYWTS